MRDSRAAERVVVGGLRPDCYRCARRHGRRTGGEALTRKREVLDNCLFTRRNGENAGWTAIYWGIAAYLERRTCRLLGVAHQHWPGGRVSNGHCGGVRDIDICRVSHVHRALNWDSCICDVDVGS